LDAKTIEVRLETKYLSNILIYNLPNFKAKSKVRTHQHHTPNNIIEQMIPTCYDIIDNQLVTIKKLRQNNYLIDPKSNR